MTKIQFVRSLLAGGIATIFDMVVLYVLTEMTKMHYLLSAVGGFLIGVTILYVLNIVWIFPVRKLRSQHSEVGIFVGLSLFSLVLNEIILYIGVDFMHMWYIAVKVMSALSVFIINFILRKKILFS